MVDIELQLYEGVLREALTQLECHQATSRTQIHDGCWNECLPSYNLDPPCSIALNSGEAPLFSGATRGGAGYEVLNQLFKQTRKPSSHSVAQVQKLKAYCRVSSNRSNPPPHPKGLVIDRKG